MSGDRLFPQLKVIASAPSADTIFNVGGEIPLVALPSPLRSRKDRLGQQKEENPGSLNIDVASDFVRDLGEEKRPIVFGLKRYMDERRNPGAKDLRDRREERRR